MQDNHTLPSVYGPRTHAAVFLPGPPLPQQPDASQTETLASPPRTRSAQSGRCRFPVVPTAACSRCQQPLLTVTGHACLAALSCYCP